MKTPEPSPLIQYFTSDGKLTMEGMKFFRALVEKQRDHDDRITALEP